MSNHSENARTLASILGISECEARDRLDKTILITASDDVVSRGFARTLKELIERTIRVLDVVAPKQKIDLEVVLGNAAPRTPVAKIFVRLELDRLEVADVQSVLPIQEVHPVFHEMASCVAAAPIIHKALAGAGPPKVAKPMMFRFKELGVTAADFDQPLDLTGSVMAGAGAVANGFLRTARHFRTRGRLAIVDPKNVGQGNAMRCLYFNEADEQMDVSKGVLLAVRAQPDFPDLQLLGSAETLTDYARRAGPPERVIVTVDSRVARRTIQKELPREVIDASTTDTRELIVHSHGYPNDGACLACVYRHVPDELARERSIAAGLGISLETVRSGLITPAVADDLAGRFQQFDAKSLVGMAFDSLFRQLCATQALISAEGRQVFAPFAFISNLTGGLLAIELLRRAKGTGGGSSYWFVDPWQGPLQRLRRPRSRHDDCEFCGDELARIAMERIWSARSDPYRSSEK